jgi:hypothetical protein
LCQDQEITVKIITGAAFALAALTTTAFAEPTETPKPQAEADRVMTQTAPLTLTAEQMDAITGGGYNANDRRRGELYKENQGSVETLHYRNDDEDDGVGVTWTCQSGCTLHAPGGPKGAQGLYNSQRVTNNELSLSN